MSADVTDCFYADIALCSELALSYRDKLSDSKYKSLFGKVQL